MKITKNHLKQLISEEIKRIFETHSSDPNVEEFVSEWGEEESEGEYKLYAPYDESPYASYDSLEKLKEDLADIVRLKQDWEDWTVETPEGSMPAYKFVDEPLH